MTQHQTSKELVVDLYKAYGEGDAQTFFASLDPDVEWVVAAGHPNGGTYVGLDSVIRDVQSHAINDWDDFRATPSFITETEDLSVVMSTGYYSGTYKSTGRSMTSRFCHVWTTKRGKVVRFESISDTGALLTALEEESS